MEQSIESKDRELDVSRRRWILFSFSRFLACSFGGAATDTASASREARGPGCEIIFEVNLRFVRIGTRDDPRPRPRGAPPGAARANARGTSAVVNILPRWTDSKRKERATSRDGHPRPGEQTWPPENRAQASETQTRSGRPCVASERRSRAPKSVRAGSSRAFPFCSFRRYFCQVANPRGKSEIRSLFVTSDRIRRLADWTRTSSRGTT